MGTTTIKAQPQRVAALDASYVDASLMLNTKVVAFTDYDGTNGKLPDYLGKSRETYGAEAASIGPLESPSLEKLAVAKPDLIVSAKVRHEREYQNLTAIAPTVFSETTGPTWKDNIRLLAKALGKEALAEERLAEYQEQARKVGDAVKSKAGPDTTISIVRFLDTRARVYGNTSFPGIVLKDAGLSRPKSQDVNSFVVQISPEQIPLADGTKIFVTSYDQDGISTRGSFEQNPLWAPLAPKVTNVQDSVWISSVSVQGAYQMLADIAKAFGVDGPSKPAWIA
ncbi:ABC transporter substrate-binding protein [Tsukamurella ocularis]|uniref:ABC transporter substrate-binding protein n=1 Tax=Tsukamurella ocularis TaxID=1970234 RepID=UPI002167C08A|nr:iron-siderophore ABC transporter substrate-binding protein [Tsukamurella ocularis]MCS3780427.1 iron complex transport system substrate-binding protein [Tsukamurella ocularis]MCS3786018.1 iron complex transport system substrate-binding protein [Tsukamurella ocularis]MCS3849382.1 iron complex transport system substrate-binding protein [Tsukamurella ocularis]